jgi:hypothetical protein
MEEKVQLTDAAPASRVVRTTEQSLTVPRRSQARQQRTLAVSGQPLESPPTAGARTREMLDIEATLDIVVDEVAGSAAKLRALVREHDAVLVEDVVSETGYASGRFLIRVATPGTDALMAAVERLGQVRSRMVNARDIGKQYNDAELQLENLTAAMRRYEQILAKADAVNDMLSIEHELTRLRGEIEQVKGNLRWMQDRVARSTIHVSLSSPRMAAAQERLAPQAKLHLGLRGVFLEDLRGDDVHAGYLGGGLSFRFSRGFSLDVDGLRRRSTGSPTKGLDVVLLAMGGEVYSEFLGDGGRKFFNPYLGWRLGYARFEGANEVAIGATFGCELVKNRYASLDLAVRGFGLLGRSAHFGIEPDLTLSLVF